MNSNVKLNNAIANLNNETIIELAIEIWYKDYIPNLTIYKGSEYTVACNIVYLLSMFNVCSKEVSKAIQQSIPKIDSNILIEYKELLQALLPYQTRHYAYKYFNKTFE